MINFIIFAAASFSNYQNNILRSCKKHNFNAILMGLATVYFQAV